MIDVEFKGIDFAIKQTSAHRAINLLNTQKASLVYAATWGIDLSLFFAGEVRIQTDVFRKYCIREIVSSGINLLDFIQEDAKLDSIFKFVVGV